MSKLFEDLEFKFDYIQTGLVEKINSINNLYDEQLNLLNQNLNLENLVEKYANGFNTQRDYMLHELLNNRNLEISNLKESVIINQDREDFVYELNNFEIKIVIFEPNKIKSLLCANKKILNNLALPSLNLN